MTLAHLHSVRQKPQIGPIELTCSIRERHSLKATVPSSAIETGAELQDHRSIFPPELAIEGIISAVAMTSDARINAQGEVVREPTLPAGYTVEESYQRLFELFHQADVFDVLTGLKAYKSMHFSSLDVIRDRSTGGILSFSAVLQRFEFANSTAAAPSTPKVADKPKAAPKENHGAKGANPSDNRSVLMKGAQQFSKNPGQSLRNLLNGLPGG